jgi:hypothetical protein
VDYLNYAGVAPSLSYGDYPDGQPFSRGVFYSPTPGATNRGQDVTVFINEWMADNTTLDDPDEPGLNFEDWIELYNPGPTPVDLSNFYMTDLLTTPTLWRIPNGTIIPAGGFLLVWADGEPSQNNISNHMDLHADFNLRAAGETIALFAADGSTLIDAVVFGQQTNNISRGRWPDGAGTFYFMTSATPRTNNFISGGNTPPSIAPISDKYVTFGQTLSFTVSATDSEVPSQTLTFSLQSAPEGANIGPGNGLFTWTPTQAQTPSTNSIIVRVEDNGAPPLSSTRSFTAYVVPPPRATLNRNGNMLSISFPTLAGRHYRVDYKDNLNAADWTVLQDNMTGTGADLTINETIGANPQRFYRIAQLD